MAYCFLRAIAAVASLAAGMQAAVAQQEIPILVPVTGFLSLEGTSQRNGALLALEDAGQDAVTGPVIDTGTSPEGAVTALDRAASGGRALAIAASMLGTQMLAMIPLADEYGLPLVTVSGTAAVTEQGSPWVFRFFPADPLAKRAHALYVVDERGLTRPALITQTTAYGQSGRNHLLRRFEESGAEVVFEDALNPSVRDMVPVLTKAMAADPDSLVLHLHSGPTALFIRQAAAMGIRLPIIAGSAMHQPSTAALLEPAELEGVCAETASSPLSADTPAMADFAARYQDRFGSEPDAFALGQYDGVRMVLAAIGDGARTPEAVRDALASQVYDGVAMTYRSDGAGNMAHSVAIVCYDGTSRVPAVVKRFAGLE